MKKGTNTYDIPWVSQIWVFAHKKAHSYNFHSHFPSIDKQKDEINRLNVVSNWINFFVKSKEGTIYNNDKKNKSIE